MMRWRWVLLALGLLVAGSGGRRAAAAGGARASTGGAAPHAHAMARPPAACYLCPHTYQLVRGMTPEAPRGRLGQRIRAERPPEIHVRAREPGPSAHQLLTLA